VDDVDLVIRAALDGVGLAYLGEDRAAPHLGSGALVRVLEQWGQPFPGFFLYYPSRRQQPAAVSALIDALRLENPRKCSCDTDRSHPVHGRAPMREPVNDCSNTTCRSGSS